MRLVRIRAPDFAANATVQKTDEQIVNRGLFSAKWDGAGSGAFRWGRSDGRGYTRCNSLRASKAARKLAISGEVIGKHSSGAKACRIQLALCGVKTAAFLRIEFFPTCSVAQEMSLGNSHFLGG
jgi:hypothetical protein